MIEKLIETNSWILLPLLVLLCGTVIVLFWIFAHYLYSWREIALEMRLKQDMLERGKSVEEIERVLWVSRTNQPPSCYPPIENEPISANQLALIERMMDDEREQVDIERMLKAVGPRDGIPS